MCGIFGLVGPGPSHTELERVNNLLTHRGPDDEGLFLDGGVALASRRLAVQDPTQAGHQPMTTADGRFTLSEVECLASCGTAPMMQVNEDYYENLDERSVGEILDKLK